jgi:hypothetical protein
MVGWQGSGGGRGGPPRSHMGSGEGDGTKKSETEHDVLGFDRAGSSGEGE